jgi:hypothetical protein
MLHYTLPGITAWSLRMSLMVRQRSGVSSCMASMRSSSPSKGEAKTGAHEPPCFGEVLGAAGGVESGTDEGILGAGRVSQMLMESHPLPRII